MVRRGILALVLGGLLLAGSGCGLVFLAADPDEGDENGDGGDGGAVLVPVPGCPIPEGGPGVCSEEQQAMCDSYDAPYCVAPNICCKVLAQ